MIFILVALVGKLKRYAQMRLNGLTGQTDARSDPGFAWRDVQFGPLRSCHLYSPGSTACSGAPSFRYRLPSHPYTLGM